MKTLNQKRAEAIDKLKPALEELINDGDLFCPHDIIIIKQGSVEVYSGELCRSLTILD